MDATQQYMDMRLPNGPYVSAKDIAAATGWTAKTIRTAITNNKIGGFSMNARAKKGSEVYESKSIPRECAILWMAKTFTQNPEMMLGDAYYIIDRFPREMVLAIYQHCAKRLKQI